MSDWEKQWRRVHRWYDRFRVIEAGFEQTKAADFYEDEVWSFFQNCYHLKDWLKNDPASGISTNEVEGYVEQSENLKLCGDLANGSKHLTITHPRFDANTKVSKRITTFAPTVIVGPPEHVAASVEPAAPVIAMIYGIEANGGTRDAFALATACVKEWETFLSSKGLSTTV